jgi:hypothetical protein
VLTEDRRIFDRTLKSGYIKRTTSTLEIEFNLTEWRFKLPAINITKGANAVAMLRRDVKPGQVFAMRGRDGKLGKNYGHIGTNSQTGRMYSVNVATGELSASSRGDREVVLTGAYKYVVNNKPTPSVERTCRRNEVRSGEAFHVNDKDTLYAHLGVITMDAQGWLSVPLARTENHAITRNGNSRVNVVATFTMDVTIAQ